jgi:glycosyltransferase involved in cell wall biosynthesis
MPASEMIERAGVNNGGFVVILPTYNNAATLPAVIEGVARANVPMIVVNDGSTDDTARWLREWAADGPHTGRWVITHEVNRGKAAALMTGFAFARQHHFSHAVTIDTDGQLDPGEIPALLELSRRHPDALIVGARNDRAADYPARSRVGRRISNLMIRLECGVRVADSQCGFRVYPLRMFESVHPRAGRYALETEIITLAGWAGFEVVNTPVTCRYEGETKLVSHFRVGRETMQSILLHARLLIMAPLRRLMKPRQPVLRSTEVEAGTR